jgi:hypothetical protein
MLLIKCARCKSKLWKYQKLGSGEVLRCHKKRISRMYAVETDGASVRCSCGAEIGVDTGDFLRMRRRAFMYSGVKVNRL